jgi:GAF domain-containing protein
LEKEITSRLKQQSALSEISQLTLSNASLKEIFHKTTEILAEALQVDYSKILRLLPQEQQFIMEAGVGWEVSGRDNYIIPKS